MPPKINLIGLRFGRLLVISENNNRSNDGNVMWECLCDCGYKKTIRSNSLRSGKTISCGCYNKEIVSKINTKHGQSSRKYRSATYSSWDSMIQRCTNPHFKQFKDYGGRGISVCKRWLKFENFYKDMGEKPTRKHTLNRFPNNDGNYELNNCRWDAMAEQSRGRRSNVWIEHKGYKMILADWAKTLKTTASAIRRSMKRGKTFDYLYGFYIKKNRA